MGAEVWKWLMFSRLGDFRRVEIEWKMERQTRGNEAQGTPQKPIQKTQRSPTQKNHNLATPGQKR